MTNDQRLIRKQVNLHREPRGEAYRRLLDEARLACNYVLLVIRDEDWPPSRTTASVEVQLRPFLVAKERKSEWPGTALLEGAATLLTYTLTEGSVGVLKKSAEGLYDWCAPELPEDLCLLRSNQAPWLVSIGHERDGYLEVSDEELAKLLESTPELGDLIERVAVSPKYSDRS